MKTTGMLVLIALLLMGCDAVDTTGSELGTANPDVAAVTPPFAPGALFERTWVDNQQWVLVKPRPPGIGAPGSVPIDFYQIAPVMEEDPLSPPIEIPDVITLGGRDHVIDPPRGDGSTFRAVARTALVQLPVWAPAFPFDAAQCGPPDLGVLDGRIAWRWLEVSVHPCGQIPLVYAVDFVGDAECFVPLTTVDRVEAAVSGGFAHIEFPPDEGPWPFAIRPMTESGQGNVTVEAPACV